MTKKHDNGNGTSTALTVYGGGTFQRTLAPVVLNEELKGQFTPEDYEGFEDDGQAYPVVEIRQKDLKDDRGKTVEPAGGFKMYDPITATTGGHIPDVSADDGVVLTIFGDQSSRVYFPGMDQPVSCRSLDGLRGDGVPGGVCATCPHNQLSSTYDGNQARCKAQKNLFAYDHNGKTPVIFRLGPSAITRWKYEKAAMKAEGQPVTSFIFKIGAEFVNDGKGQYFIPTFQRIGQLDLANFNHLREIRTAAGVGLKKSMEIVTDDESVHVNGTIPTTDAGGELPPGVQRIDGVGAKAGWSKPDDEVPFL